MSDLQIFLIVAYVILAVCAARRGRNQQLLVDLTSAGEHWTTKGDTA